MASLSWAWNADNIPTSGQIADGSAEDLRPGGVSHIMRGHNPNVGASPETVWPEGGLYPWLLNPADIRIASDDNTDAGLVEVVLVDAKGTETVKTSNLNGFDPMQLGVNLRVQSIAPHFNNQGVIRCGTMPFNGAGVPAATLACASNRTGAGGTSLLGTWTVPLGFDVGVAQFSASGSNDAVVTLRAYPPSTSFPFIEVLTLQHAKGSSGTLNYTPVIPIHRSGLLTIYKTFSSAWRFEAVAISAAPADDVTAEVEFYMRRSATQPLA